MSEPEGRAHLNWYQLGDRLDIARAQRDAAIKANYELRAERDEARNAAGEYAANEFRILAERDEARAEVVRLGKQSEAKRIYVAMVADRHLDPAPYLFSDLDAALTFVKAEALKLARSENYIEEVTTEGFLYMATCGEEGDYVWIVEREIDGSAPDA